MSVELTLSCDVCEDTVESVDPSGAVHVACSRCHAEDERQLQRALDLLEEIDTHGAARFEDMSALSRLRDFLKEHGR